MNTIKRLGEVFLELHKGSLFIILNYLPEYTHLRREIFAQILEPIPHLEILYIYVDVPTTYSILIVYECFHKVLPSM